jgi:hypothetical protein
VLILWFRICSLRNLELAQRLQASSPGTATYLSGIQSVGDDGDDDITIVARRSNTLGSSRLDPDNVSVISNAFSAINLASKLKKSSSTAHVDRETRRFQPQLEPVSPTSPVLDALKAASEREFIDEFIDEIVSLSEELQLYSQNPSLPQSPQQLAKITSTAMKLCDSLQPQRRGSMTAPRFNLPEVESPIESFRESIFSTLSSYSNITSTTEWSPNQPNPMGISPGHPNKTISMPNVDTHPAVETEPQPREAQRQRNPVLASQSGTFIMDIGPPAKQPLAFTVRLFEASIVGVVAIECTLDFAEAGENSPFCSITAIAVNQRRKSPSSRIDRESVALTPQTHLDLPENDSINDVRHSTDHRRIFHHKFIPNRRPFPHILHPDVEGPGNEKDAPYTITFAVPQLFEEEGVASSPTRPTNLKYIFSSKEDRTVLQSLIFGKALIFSTGIKKVITTDPSKNHSDDQQAVRMWLSKDRKTKSITVYFKDGKPRQKLYKEYQILGLHSDMLKLKQLKSKTPVQILVVEEARGITFDSRRRSSSTSAQTFSSGGSAGSVNSKPLTCCLHFSEDGDNAKFLEFLARPFDIRAS